MKSYKGVKSGCGCEAITVSRRCAAEVGWGPSLGSGAIGRHHTSGTYGGACPPVGQLDYVLSGTSPAAVYTVYKVSNA